jgi:lipid II:glycine glycyltransferase (peptidoglycan interpeptide bridge formation enzyme)
MAHWWNSLIASLPLPHVLQTWEWSQVKAHYGWEPFFLLWDSDGQFHVLDAPHAVDMPMATSHLPSRQGQPGSPPRFPAAALLLQRAVPAGGFAARMRILYLPKGPCLDWSDSPLRGRVLADLQNLARRRGAIFVKMDPDIPAGQGIPGEAGSLENPLGQAVVADLQGRDWRISPEQIQFRNTVLIDLAPVEEELLKRMKQKTRYNIHLAMRKGLTVRPGSPADLDLLYKMYAETSLRDGFVIRDRAYYRLVWDTFLARPGETGGADIPVAEPLIAEVGGDPVAAVIIFRFAGKAWYLYGMSRPAHREKMPNALLQWEAMRRAKAAGCICYDLWGAPDVFNESDPLWGVFRFKEGFGGVVARTPGAWDLPLRPVLYRLYTTTLPRLLDFMRRRGRQHTRQSIGA